MSRRILPDMSANKESGNSSWVFPSGDQHLRSTLKVAGLCHEINKAVATGRNLAISSHPVSR